MVSYLVMATGLGVTFVPIHYHGHAASNYRFLRELFYARSIDWLFTTPLLLLSLAFLSGLSPYETTLAILADVFMIVTGLFASLVPARWAPGERARWGFFTVSCVAFLWIWWILITNGLKGESSGLLIGRELITAAKERPRKTRGLFTLLSGMTLVLWTAYPIVFALGEGTNKISADAEIISYAVLDVSVRRSIAKAYETDTQRGQAWLHLHPALPPHARRGRHLRPARVVR